MTNTTKPIWALAAVVALALTTLSANAQPTGHQLFVGPVYSGPPPQSVPFAPATLTVNGSMQFVTIYLHRADDAGTAHSPALSFDLVWDPAVLGLRTPPSSSVTTPPLLVSWYDKQRTVNFAQAANGRLSVSIFGGVTFDPDDFEAFSTEITTFNNQLPLIAPEAGTMQQNPFPLLTIGFVVTGRVGDSTPLAFEGAILSDQSGFPLPNQGALDTTVQIGGNFPPPPPGTPAMGLPAAALLGVALLTLALRRA